MKGIIFMRKKIIAGVLSVLLFNLVPASVFATGLENFNWSNQARQFTDVPQDSWYYKAVSEASSCGIINGVGNNQFNPYGTLTHAEAMTLMAKTNAIYRGKEDELAKAQASSTANHWAFGLVNFCKENALPYPDETEFDTPVTRSTMAHYFYNSIPKLAFNTGISNHLDDMPEETTNITVQNLFKAGILVGDDSGFRLEDSITRAETAAIIQRVANPNARIEIHKQHESQWKQGEIQTDKPYKRIPNTQWSTDPTNGITVHSHFGDINTKYGNHSYGCRNQQEYDKVMSVIDEAFAYACKNEKSKVYNKSVLEQLVDSESNTINFFENEIGIRDEQEIANIRIAENTVNDMRQYLIETYAKPNGVGTNDDVHNNNVHKYLFAGGLLDCDGNGYLNMLCWDYLGFSTRMITSIKISHATSQVCINGRWIMVNQDSGKLDFCTHEQLLELIHNIKNDAYSTHDDTDAMIKNASITLDNGKLSNKPDDLEIWSNETPTHNPYDNSVI